MIKIDHTTMVQDPVLGYYTIGNKTYWDKASALIGGTKDGLTSNDLHWNFNDDCFSKFNWTVEPPGSIRSYYHKRARDLREKYDYLILNCSGGADSTTMLYSFIQQGLHVDEVIVRRAGAGTNKYGSAHNVSAANEFSEFQFAAIPLLQWLKSVSPTTKITIHDFSLDIINPNINWDENFIHWCGDYVTPGCIVRYTHASDKSLLNLFDHGKRIGLLFGTDKPILVTDNNNYYVYFVDRAVHSAIPSTVNNGFVNTNVELFYWHPDCLEMMAKQCHLIKRWAELPMNQQHAYILNKAAQVNPAHRTLYQAVIKGIIYPDYDLLTFQCNKPEHALYQEWDYWTEDFANSVGMKTFASAVSYLRSNIDKSFLREYGSLPGTNGNRWEYKLCTSRMINIGSVNTLAAKH